MSNPADPSDHNLGPIEVAIRETARGRAFLAEYARRVRDSDTLTLIAMVRRLERVCRNLSACREEFDEHAVESATRVVENSSGLSGRSDLDEMERVAATGFAGVDQNRETLDRIAQLVNVLRYSGLSGAKSTDYRPGIVPETILSGSDEIDVRSAERDENPEPFRGAQICTKARSQQEVLGDITKALATSVGRREAFR